ncbi:hypothetical protein AADC60_16130 [Cytobacillus pseudoceanisediminis]|uniref:AAA+ ATPase domain-containing protein n=1 Tax=Cytobacillus pseudoceanisediminis TaxID=3051614 RepID=A0ABZ2ZBT7_9BACI
MITKTSNFKSSVNVKFDLDNIEIIRKYMPTPSHADSLNGILAGFNTTGARRSHIIIGPYGTGKSMLSTLLASIVTKNISENDFSLISQKFSSLDDEIYNGLLKSRDLDKKYYPVVLNGYEGKFKHSILSAILKTLSSSGIELIVPGVMTKILETVEIWQKNYPKAYKQFKALLKERNKSIDIWRLEILSQDKFEIEWFKNEFPKLTSGAEFLVDLNEDFIDQMKYIIDEMEKLNIGLFIVYDEFGRYLQSIERNEINETMQNLQDLAELTDHYNDNIHLLFITHKHLRHYFSSFDKELQNEFQRIEKRFRLYYIASDSATFYRIAENVINSIDRDSITDEKKNLTTQQLRKYAMFPQLNQVEIENLIVKHSYPVHPVALFLLPFLSSHYGQNERTLFTFLESSDSFGLIDHINNDNGYYLPYKLFNFFFPNFEEQSFEANDKSADLYKKLIQRIPELTSDELKLKIVQTITLWELCGLQGRIKLSTELLSFALDTEKEVIAKSLLELERLKGIRYNRVLGYWELFEGSAYDIDELIQESVANYRISKTKKIEILERCLTKKYFLAREYNDEKSITRFASINIVTSGDILERNFNPVLVREEKSPDALINFVLLEDSNQYDSIIKSIENYQDVASIFCINPTAFKSIEQKVTTKYIVQQLINDPDIINNDKKLKQELQLYLEDITYDIKKYLDAYLNFSQNLTWIVKGKTYQINNEIKLEEILSHLMFELYPLTPEVRNDGYNRRKINNVQLKAGYKLIEHILHNPFEKDLGIEGNGPEYLIYATVFKNNGLNLSSLDSISSNELMELRSALLLELTKGSEGSLDKLVNIMVREPFGIRKPLIPVLLVALLRDKWDQLLFYRNGMFISQLNGEHIYTMVSEPDQYQFVFMHFKDEINSFVGYLQDLFRNYINPENQGLNRPLLVISAMLNWLRDLPRYVQITRTIDSNLVALKDSIKLAEIDPKVGLEKIYEQFKDQPDLLKHMVDNLNTVYLGLEDEVKNIICNKIGVNDYSELKFWVENQQPSVLKDNQLAKSLKNNINSKEWVKNVSYDLVGVELQNWSDKTKEMFFNQLNYEFSKINMQTQTPSDSVQIQMGDGVKVIRKSKLSTKSQTLHTNVARILKNGGRNVPKEEIENIVLLLIKEFVE